MTAKKRMKYAKLVPQDQANSDISLFYLLLNSNYNLNLKKKVHHIPECFYNKLDHYSLNWRNG